MSMSDEQFMRAALEEAMAGLRSNCGGPFGCVVVRDGAIVARGKNCVTSTNDPTAHAEIAAIREACRALNRYSLEDCTLYASCEPCPMCLAAIYWARIPRIVYANTRADAAAIGFDDDFIYRQVALPPAQRAIDMRQLLRDEAQAAFREWEAKPDKLPY